MSTAWNILGLRGAIALALAIALAVVTWRADVLSADRDRWEGAARILAGRVIGERAAHQQTKTAYRAAQQAAAELDARRIARVQAEQQEITDEITRVYRLRLADARARADRLRAEATRAGEHPTSAPGGERVPGGGATAGRADEAPADHRLSLDERLIATEQAVQLHALIDWVERLAAVNVNSPEAAR